MKDYNKSFYALNKKSKGIVYQNADGSILEVTFEKISAENPNFTKEDFEKIKELSDGLYHQEANNDYKYHYHITGTYDVIADSAWLASENLEDEIIVRCDSEFFSEQLQKALDTVLTPTQKRRFLMYVCSGLTFRKIAELEGVNHNKILRSVNDAKRKIRKFIKNF